MIASVVAAPSSDTPATGTLLVVGVVLATLTEAIASTVLSLGRSDIIGDTHATPDEFAWLDVGYTALKLIGFMAAPRLMSRIDPRTLIVGSTLAMGAAAAIAAITTRLELLVALRIVQGFAGGTLLVAGQTIVFLAYPQQRQPILQALFAMGAVVAPATIAPALHGWLIDSQSWTWIFFSIVPLALAAAGLLLFADSPTLIQPVRLPFDWIGISLLSAGLFCLTYVFSQGSRWDWFEDARITWLTVAGTATLLAFVGQQVITKGRSLLDFTLFRSADFSFAFIVSFVAGAALFGSAFLIPSFAVTVLAFTPTDAGLLLLPSSALFIGALLIAAFLGYSRLMGRDESGTLARLRRTVAEHLDPVLAQYGGRLVKLTGDGALVEFASAVDALSAAIEFQQAMAEANRDQPADTALVFRMGLHLGDLIVDGDDLYGDGVNVAARLEAEAPAGGIVISRTVHEAVAGRVKATFDDLGNLALKNIERPVQAFSVKWEPSDWRTCTSTAEALHLIAHAATSADAAPAARQAVDRRAAVPEHERRSRAGVLRRRHGRGHHHRAVALQVAVRDRAQFELHLQGQLAGHPAGRPRARRALRAGRQRAQGREHRFASPASSSTARPARISGPTLDGALEDVFELQDQVTESVVGAIAPKLEQAEIERARQKPTESLDATITICVA